MSNLKKQLFAGNDDGLLSREEKAAPHMFYLPGFGEPGREHEFRPMTVEETAEANARYQDELYRQMEKDLPKHIERLQLNSSDDDDFSDDDRASNGSRSRQNNQSKAVVEALDAKYVQADLRSVGELEMLLDVRSREIERITEEGDKMRLSMQKQIDELEQELRQVSTEKLRATVSLEEAQKLLLTKTTESSKLAEELDALRKDNEKLSTDFEISNLTCKDLQKKLILMEKGSKDKVELLQLERQFSEREEKYKRELKHVEDELIESAKKCKSLEIENMELINKVRHLKKCNEEVVMEKAEIMKKMAKEMEALKEQLSGGSVIQLQLELARKQAREEELQSQIRELQRRYDDQLEELRLLRVASSERPRSNQDGTSSLLHSELVRVCAESKSHRAEISKLQAVLHEKETLEATQGNELALTRRLLADKEAQIDRLEERLKEEISKRVEDVNVSLSDDQKVTEINEENEKLRKQLEIMERNLHKLSTEASQRPDIETFDRYNQEYLKFHEAKMDSLRNELEKQFEVQLQSREAVIENLRGEIEEVKNEYLKLKESQTSYVERLRSQEEEILTLRKKIEAAKNDSPGVEIVKELQIELEASRKRVLELSKSVMEHCQEDTSQYEARIKDLTAEKDRIALQLKDSETLVLNLRNQVKEGLDAIVALHSKLTQYEKEREMIKGDYESKLKILESELKAKLTAADSKLREMEEALALKRKTPDSASRATSPIARSPEKKVFTEDEIKRRLEYLAEVHEKELRDVELQYSLALAKHIHQLRASISNSSGAPRILTADIATNTEGMAVVTSTDDDHGEAARQAFIEQYKLALEAAVKECENLRRRLLEEEVHSTTEIRRLGEKHDSYKDKVRRYKTHFNDALRRIQQEFERERERYNRTLNEIQKEVNALKRVPHEALTSAQVNTVARLYDEKIETVRKLLQQYETKGPKR